MASIWGFGELEATAEMAAGAIAGGFDGLTEAILLEAEIAATRRLDWRMALENIAAVLKRLLRQLCNQLRLMQEEKRGDVDGVEDGSSNLVREESRFVGRNVCAKSTLSTKGHELSGPSCRHNNTATPLKPRSVYYT